ncbi:aminopeptidase P N-terminal domain-containing protein [Anaerocolumna sp. AGMB13025]|uniref:aminopeptidase P N-terminal domain-containing protein n=1 Tax=Anaerocolumna sp. AGMB13025 TaxID=3039116 RepID=UPI00241D7BF8|nr:aminopeptidase P N-terminal domain-containing protein [Anaerocolumna sp. AGMB13025]WFR59762.1 aminopeptidase P N-terminal domain-containing protein [Anaerocolumna sp. AGMB13025]
MKKEFHKANRTNLLDSLEPGSLAVLFSGQAPRKTGDEYYPFFANRSFVYLTGIEQEQSILTLYKQATITEETLFLLPPDLMAERWTGKRLTDTNASDLSGITIIKPLEEFKRILEQLIDSGAVEILYFDFDKLKEQEPDNEAYTLAAYLKTRYPFLCIKNLQASLRKQRTIKQSCEIEAMKKAEEITKAGIIAMMQASKPGMYEYQYKAEFDYVLANHGVLSPGFPSIISAGKNNFCIHYYDYRGQALDGDMILNDVGACYDNMINDVSRGWPCNGKFNEKQRLLYECAYATSNYMFDLLKPGIPMKEVDLIARKFNYEQLKNIGLCEKYEDAGKYIWHGGAHHVGYDVHDRVSPVNEMITAPGMVFCVDIGIYCEEWGIGFRLEDNCLITEHGCENLSSITPRSIEEIEAVMGKR